MAEIISDFQVDFSGGQDRSRTPDNISPSHYSSAVNVQTKNGRLSPRWGLNKLPLEHADGFVETKTKSRRSNAQIFKQGKFQAQIPYSIGSEFYQIIVISGVIFLVNQDTLETTVLELEGGDRISQTAHRINWSVAGRFLVLFDFPANPVIIEGIQIRRSDDDEFEVPVSVLGAYNQNRLFIANAGNDFTAGDPAGNLATPDAPITFEEVFAEAAAFKDQAFELTTSYNNDVITAMAFLQVADISTGIGPLLVSTPQAIYSYQTQLTRMLWVGSEFGSVLLFNAGIAGQRAFTNTNSDLIFLSGDGQVRSLSMSREEQKKWSNVSMSREVENYLKFNEKDFARFGVAQYFENKVLVTANPYRTTAKDIEGNDVSDFAHGGFVVLELDNISSLRGDSPPVWAGLWTGVQPMDMSVNNDRMFVMSKDFGSTNVLYEMTPDVTVDRDGDKRRQVRSIVYSRSYGFEDSFRDKRLHSVDLNFMGIKGEFSLDLKYKPSHAPNYIDWNTFKHNAPYLICCPFRKGEGNGLAPHNLKVINLGTPDSEGACDEITEEPFINFRKTQLRLEIKGDSWELDEFKVKATITSQSENQRTNFCDGLKEPRLIKDFNDDWVTGAF